MDVDWDKVLKLISKKENKKTDKNKPIKWEKSDLKRPEHNLYMHSNKNNTSVGEVFLLRSGAYITFKNYDAARLREIHSWFTIKTKLGFKKMFKTISAYQYNGVKEEICIPRFGLLSRLISISNIETLQFANPIIRNTLNEYSLKYDNSNDYILDGTLSHNQKITIEWLMKNVYTQKKIDRGAAGCIVQMPTGTGKTFLGAGMIAECKVPTLVVCRDSGDCSQWVKTLETVFPTATIGQYHSKCKVDGDVIVAVFKSVAEVEKFEYHHPTRYSIKKSRRSEKFFKRFGLIIWDECHDYCTQLGLKAFRRAQAPRMMGLTATPHDRPDKFNKVAEWYLGPVINAMGIKNYELDETNYRCHVKAVYYKGPAEFTKPIINQVTDQISTTAMIQQMIEDPYRLQLVCECIIDLYQKGKNIVVFADRKSYLDILSTTLQNIHNTTPWIMTDADETRIITGGAKSQELENAQTARIILTTYAYFGTGKSVKNLNAIVFATPRKSHTMQYIGRIFRKGSDPTIRRYIVDIIDKKTSLHRQYYKRKKVYDVQDSLNRKFRIDKIEVDFGDVVFEAESKRFTKEELAEIIQSIKK